MNTTSGLGRRLIKTSALLAAVWPVSQAVAAPVIYDLRFDDGSHTKLAVPGLYTAELWVQVRGSNGSYLDDGLQDNIVTIQSKQFSGGAIDSGGITSASVASEFQSFSGTSPLFINGTGSDLNADGIVDWGSTSTNGSQDDYFFSRSSAMTLGGGTVGHALDAASWEFKIGTFMINITNATGNGTGTTHFDVVKPKYTTVTGASYIVAQLESAHFNVTQLNQQGAYTNSIGIAFVPEPSSVAAVGVATGLALLSRKRRGLLRRCG